MKKMLRVMGLAALAAVIMLTAATAIAEETDHDEHYARCASPTVCAVGGESYSGNDIRHADTVYEDRGNASAHWEVCSSCGETFGGPYAHVASCRNREKCVECGGSYPDMEYDHNSKFVGYEYRDAKTHTVTCAYCKDSWSEKHYGAKGHCVACDTNYEEEEQEHFSHYAECTNPDVCAVGGEEYAGNDIRHGEAVLDDCGSAQYHWYVCGECGEALDGPYEHWASCDNRDVCEECGAKHAGMSYAHDYEAIEIKSDGSKTHTTTCTLCGESRTSEHYTLEDDPAGYCSACGAAYSSAGTDEPTATTQPAATAAPTAEPASSASGSAAGSQTADRPALEADGDDLPLIDMSPSALLNAVYGRPWSENEAALAAEPVTVALDEANGSYGGSTLTVYPAGAEGKTSGVRLTSAYGAERTLMFDAWRKNITNVELLRGSEDFVEFIANARALVKTQLPALSADEVDELLVLVLQSGADEGISDKRWVSIFEHSEVSEIYGVLEHMNHEFRLMRREESVILDICKAR